MPEKQEATMRRAHWQRMYPFPQIVHARSRQRQKVLKMILIGTLLMNLMNVFDMARYLNTYFANKEYNIINGVLTKKKMKDIKNFGKITCNGSFF